LGRSHGASIVTPDTLCWPGNPGRDAVRVARGKGCGIRRPIPSAAANWASNPDWWTQRVRVHVPGMHPTQCTSRSRRPERDVKSAALNLRTEQ
jgi:hypothetical protein